MQNTSCGHHLVAECTSRETISGKQIQPGCLRYLSDSTTSGPEQHFLVLRHPCSRKGTLSLNFFPDDAIRDLSPTAVPQLAVVKSTSPLYSSHSWPSHLPTLREHLRSGCLPLIKILLWSAGTHPSSDMQMLAQVSRDGQRLCDLISSSGWFTCEVNTLHSRIFCLRPTRSSIHRTGLPSVKIFLPSPIQLTMTCPLQSFRITSVTPVASFFHLLAVAKDFCSQVRK